MSATYENQTVCTQVKIVFVVWLWLYIHTEQAEKYAWPQGGTIRWCSFFSLKLQKKGDNMW